MAVALGTPVSALLEELELAPAKPLLLGGMLGHFASAPALTSEFISYDSVYDSIRIFTDKHCMATIAKGLLSAAAETSCGKCVICREGSWQLKAVFTDVTEGRAKKEDLDLVTDIGELIGAGSFAHLEEIWWGRRYLLLPAPVLILKPILYARPVRLRCVPIFLPMSLIRNYAAAAGNVLMSARKMQSKGNQAISI